MRRIIVGTTLLLAVTAVLLVVQSTLAGSGGSSGGSEEVVFSSANSPTDFTYTTPPPPKPDHHFGFWIWCEGPNSGNAYTGNCNGAMYFYVFGVTRPVKGTVSGSGGIFTMTVWSTDSTPTIACSLTNGTAFTGHGSERQAISVICPPEGSSLNPTVQGSGTADEAVVNITGQ